MKFVKNSHSHPPLKCFKTHPAISPSRPRDSISFEFKKKRNFTRRDAKDVIWRMENTHFTASRTNQILMEALMRGYSGRPEGTRKMKSGGEGSWRGERAALFLRARIILFFSFFSSLFFFFCGFAPLHSGVYSSHVRLPPGRNNNCYYSSP